MWYASLSSVGVICFIYSELPFFTLLRKRMSDDYKRLEGAKLFSASGNFRSGHRTS
jgi:hypothetical protein